VGCEESGIGPCGEVGPLRNGKRDRARSKSRISGSTSHSMSYSPHCCVRESVSEKKKTWGDCVERQRERRRKLWMIVITGLTGNLSGNRLGRWPEGGSRCTGWTVITAEETEPQEGRVTPLGCSGRTA
jgi:hypothetical protein